MTTNNLKFLCSYGGKLVPRHSDGKLRYLGGQTRVLAVHRSISFSDLVTKLGEFAGAPVTLRCQLPEADLDDALVSIVSDEDLANLIEVYDRFSSMKIRAFLSIPRNRNRSPPLLSSSSSSSLSSSSSSSLSSASSSNSSSAATIGSPRCSRCRIPKPPARKVAAGYYAPVSHGGRAYLVHSGNHWQ
ncbi:hypothetical protein LINGRAHAP2_LOCUS37025 [Linum grandiflorum]